MKINPDNCPNCGCETRGRNFCPDCGQVNGPIRPTLRQVLTDFIDDYFSLDSRLFKTIFALIFKPGFLSTEYNDGKRMAYLPPFRTYLLISILFFLIPTADKQTNITVKGTAINEVSETISFELASGDSLTINFQELQSNTLYADSIGNRIWADSKESKVCKLIGEKITTRFVINSMLIGSCEDKRSSFWNALWRGLSRTMFILMPVFAVILFLLFRTGTLNYVNMLVFSIHLHSFVFLILAVKELFVILTGISVPLVHVLIIGVYGIVALKKVFNHSYLKTTLKAILLSSIYLIFMLIGLIGATFYAVYVS